MTPSHEIGEIVSYKSFIASKFALMQPSGISTFDRFDDGLFPHQSVLTQWALRRGRAAIFADTGMGKTRMQVAWGDNICRATGGSVLILAPLAVAPQTVAEGLTIGVSITHARDGADVVPGINITNYDRLHRFDPSRFVGVILDESSCIKHHASSTFNSLVDAFAATPYKLCATATPAPNDWTELGTHAEFLGICSRQEMLSEYFVHDGGDTQTWRLKGHARSQFWRWVSSWGALVRRPSDLGFDDSGYVLPPISVREHIVDTKARALDGMLFALEANTLSERRSARKFSMADRVSICADIANSDDEPRVIWCELNAESEALTDAIRGAVEVRGSDDPDTKESALMDFASGKILKLVTKPSIAGWGLNWQHCARMSFVGVSDSFESYYQAIRRCWRFGQKREVIIDIIASAMEGAVVSNLRRKERDALVMGEALSAETRAAVKAEVFGAVREHIAYNPTRKIATASWIKSEDA